MRYLLFYLGLFPLGLLAQAPLQTLPPCPGSARDDAVAHWHRGALYGGFGMAPGFFRLSDWWRYEAQNTKWEALPQPPLPPGQYHISFCVDDTLYLLGGNMEGNRATAQFWAFHFHDYSWQALPQPPLAPRWGGIALVQGHQVLVGLGQNEKRSLADCWLYRADRRQWQPAPHFPGASRSKAFGLSEGSWHLVGGGEQHFDDGSPPLYHDDIWRFHFAERRWELCHRQLPDSAAYHYALMKDLHLYLYGGWGRSSAQANYKTWLWRWNLIADEVQKDIPQGLIFGRGGHWLADDDGGSFLLWGLDSQNQRLNQLAYWPLSHFSEYEDWQVFPNPAQQNCWLRSPAGGYYRIYDKLGRLWAEKKLPSAGLYPVMVADWPAGIYFVRGECPNGDSQSFRLLVKN